MDTIAWFIATLHSMLGHDKAAAYMNVPAGSKDDCMLCAYERASWAEQLTLRSKVIDAMRHRDGQ